MGDLIARDVMKKRKEIAPELEEWDELPVKEMLGKIPMEWEQDFWKRKLCLELHPEIKDRFHEDPE